MIDKKTKIQLLVLFIIFFAIKAGLTIFHKSPYFFSDESCAIARAYYFAAHFKIESCSTIANAPGGDPMPFYSILISPLYFFSKATAYKLGLILNAFLISSLIFPLFKIFSKFINPKKHKIYILLASTVIIFLPAIIIYEKMLLTESFFVVANIYTLNAYLKYIFEKKKKKLNLILTAIFATMAAFTRPFGFIIFAAILVNESIKSKNKKKVFFILLPIFLISFITAITINTGIVNQIYTKIINITDPNYFFNGLKALKDQFNSFIIATFFVPFILFITTLKEKNLKNYNKIKFFLLTFIILNYLISANHLHGYLIRGDVLDLITRYINMSIIYIFIAFFILINNIKSFKLTLSKTIILILTLISVSLINYGTVKHALNLSLSIFYDTTVNIPGNLFAAKSFLPNYFTLISIVLFIALLKSKKTLIALVSIIFIIQSALLYQWHIEFSNNQYKNDYIFQEFKNSDKKILYLRTLEEKNVPHGFWRLISLKDKDTYFVFITNKKNHTEPDLYSEKSLEYFKDFDLINSNIIIKLPIYSLFENNIFYFAPKGSSYEEQVQQLTEENTKFIPFERGVSMLKNYYKK